MTKNNKSKEEKKLYESLGYDWRNLELANVAGEYLQRGDEEGMALAKKSLEMSLKDINCKDSWLIKTVTDPEVIQKTIQNQLADYKRCKTESNETVGDLLKYYEETFNENVGTNREQAEKELKPFLKNKYEDILKAYLGAQHTLKGKDLDKYDEKELKSAEKVIEKYQKVVVTINTLQNRKNSDFKYKVEKELEKEQFDRMYTPKETKSKK